MPSNFRSARITAAALAALILGGSALSPSLLGADASTPGVAGPVVAEAGHGPRGDVGHDHDAETSVRFDSLPTVGGSSVLHVDVTSHAGGPVPVEVTVPSFLAVRQVPEGVSRSSVPGNLAGTIDTVLSWSPSLAPEGHASIAVGVTARGEGSDLVVAAAGEGAHRAEDSVPITIDAQGASEQVEPHGSLGTLPEPPTPPTDVAPAPAPQASVSAQAASGPTWAVGRFAFVAPDGSTKPGRGWRVEVWDRDVAPNNPPDRLATGRTDANGDFRLSWANNVEANNAGGQDPFVRFIADHPHYQVRLDDGDDGTADGPLVIETPVAKWNVATGSVTSFGQVEPTATQIRGARAFDALRRGYDWVPKSAKGCWDENDTTCRKAIAEWGPMSGNVDNEYLIGPNVMSLTPGVTDDITLHELGHAVMDDLYDDAYPKRPNCNPHAIRKISSAGCAWTEGFAEWFPTMVQQSSRLFGLDFEVATWGSPSWDNGDRVEGRVAGALIDLSDRTNDGYDIYSINPTATPWQPGVIWNVVSNQHPNTMKQFWDRFPQKGNILAQGALLQNTIDYNAPKADLLVGAVMVQGPITRGVPVTVTDRTQRTNDNTSLWAGASTTAYYLSTDTTKSSGDRLLGSREVPLLFSAGQSHTGSASVVVPSSVPAGSTYYVLACADDRQVVPEKSEVNNCSTSATLIVR